ncbi:MAG: SPOR domain-containing protein [Pseudomonadota bacterium]|nr:SPOR domain-containing protein [Pseudomonadota bacterium]
MAFFKFRQHGQPEPEPAERGRARGKASAAPAPAPAPDSIESMRRRARNRLLGAAVLVLLAIIGFPLLFDTQPRPVAVNAPIVIPDRDQVAPLRIPELVSADASLGEREEVVTSGAAAPAARPPVAVPTPPPARDTRPEPPAPGADEARAQATQAEQAAARARREEEARAQREEERARAAQARRDEEQARREQQARAKREAEQRAQREEAARARALLEGRSPAAAQPAATTAAPQGGRFIVQVGAFADDAAVREARQKVERAGLRTYTQVVNTKDGPRTRVRVGPFGSREEADKAAATLKKAGLAGAVLSL